MELKFPIPSAVSPQELRLMRRCVEGKRVVEAGALLGFSTIHLARSAASLVSIDRHEGYGPSTERAFRSNILCHSLNHVQIIVADAAKVVNEFEADVAFLDLTGKFDTTFNVLSRVKSNLALVHDVGRQSCHEVELAIKAAGFKVVEGAGTLALCERRIHGRSL